MIRIRLRPGSLAHVVHGVPYYLLNSIRGLRAARRLRKTRADRDLQITRDGVIVVTHWVRPLTPHGPRGHDVFIDPLRRLSRDRTIASMTWDEVSRLRTRRGAYRINRLSTDIAEAGRLRMGLVLEPKTTDVRWQDPDLWRRIRDEATAAGVPKVTGYALRANRAAVPAMNAGGIPSYVLSH